MEGEKEWMEGVERSGWICDTDTNIDSSTAFKQYCTMMLDS